MTPPHAPQAKPVPYSLNLSLAKPVELKLQGGGDSKLPISLEEKITPSSVGSSPGVSFTISFPFSCPGAFSVRLGSFKVYEGTCSKPKEEDSDALGNQYSLIKNQPPSIESLKHFLIHAKNDIYGMFHLLGI